MAMVSKSKLTHVEEALLREWRKDNSAKPGDGDTATDYFVGNVTRFAEAAMEAVRRFDLHGPEGPTTGVVAMGTTIAEWDFQNEVVWYDGRAHP